MTNSHRIPVTILTGFLGAGKTTLLNRILSEKHGLKIALLENEFGEINIDSQLVVNADENVVEMSNGCICCSSQGDFVHQLLELTALRARFDYVVVEATGVADPASVLDVFLRNEDLREYYRLDGVITLVDALHVTQHISEAVCQSQIAFGDVVVINKADLVNEAKLQEVDRLVRAINPLAELYRTSNSAVPFEALLNIGQFDEERTRAALARAHAEGDGHEHCDHDHGHCEHDHTHCDHDHGHCLHDHSHCDHDHGVCTVEGQERGSDAGSRFVCDEAPHPHHQHVHEGIGSLGIERAGDIDPNRFGEWLSKLLAENGADIFRVKGILSLPGVANKFVVQAVHSQIDEPAERGPWNGAARVNQIVFIGRNLDRVLITRGFEDCLIRN